MSLRFGIIPIEPSDAESARSATATFIDSGLRGERLGATPCARRSSILCSRVLIVASFSVDAPSVQGDTARVGARYVVIGALVQRDIVLQYVPRDTLQAMPADTVLLARSADRWHVVQRDSDPASLTAGPPRSRLWAERSPIRTGFPTWTPSVRCTVAPP